MIKYFSSNILTMSSSHPSVVIADRDQVIDSLAMSWVDNVGGHVQVLERELYHGVDLVPPVSVVGEPLEVDDQHLRQAPEVELLGGLLVLLTIGTVPGNIVFIITTRVEKYNW